MYAIDEQSGGYVNPATADSPPSNIIDTGMFKPSPFFFRSGLVAGESGGVPGFESTSAAAAMPPMISSASPSWWDSIKNDMGQAVQAIEDAPGALYTDFKGITKTVYGDISSGVGTVFKDVTTPVAEAATSYYWYAILGLIVVAGGIYFIGKSGAVRVHAVV